MNKKILIVVWLGILSCNKNKCPDGYFCQEDKCICPEGSFETYGVCRQLEDNEFYGVTDEHCPCQDSIIMRVTVWDNDKFKFETQRGFSWGKGGGPPYTIRNDTIFPYTTIMGLHCRNTDVETYITLGGYGIISNSKDTLIFYVPIAPLISNWENPDTCKIVFHK